MLPTFCRVTGNSRNLPKPNYFPLLPPISPVEARRLCRLMGKAVPSEEHQYVPLIEFARVSRAVRCHITSHADESHPHHYQQQQLANAASGGGGANKCRITAKHQINNDYRYLYPVIKGSTSDLKQLKIVLERMNSRLESLTIQAGQRFVYQLDDNQLNLVLPADMEAAIRRGEIENLLLSNDGSTVLIRLKDGPSLTLTLLTMTPTPEDGLLQGAGQDDEILAKQRQIRQYKKRKVSDPKRYNLVQLAPPAGPPDKQLEEEDEGEPAEKIIVADWNDRMVKLTGGHRSAGNLLAMGTDWRDLVYPKIESWDWDSFPTIKEEEIPNIAVHQVEPIDLDVDRLYPGTIQPNQMPVLTEDTVGFEAVPIYDEVIRPFRGQLPAHLVDELDTITADQASSSTHRLKDIFSDVESLMFLPFIHEVASVVEALDRGTNGWMIRTEEGDVQFVQSPPTTDSASDSVKSVSGKMVPIGKDEERFVVGQQLPKNGFVPGKMVGDSFQPGCVVQNPEGAGFIPGCIFGGVFTAGQISRDGQPKFVCGQAVQTLFGPKFLPGRTIQTDEGPKFAAGQTSVSNQCFHAGQIFQTPGGPTFVPGVTFDTPQGARFIAGQTDINGQFVPGQVLTDVSDENKRVFTPGENLETADGPLFLPGQSYKAPDGRTKFCPGRQIVLEDGQARFIPGETMIAEEGRQFVAGILAEERFMPCRIDPQSHQLRPATKEEEVYFCPAELKDGLPIDNSTFSAMPRKKPDMGYMIQHEDKVKFLPTEQNQDELMVGSEAIKVVPGQLLELDDTPKFIPGKTIESALGNIFIPGQAVRTGPNKVEQFVPGQVIDTGTSSSIEGVQGPIFCPGQMVNCETGKKFVPGQVFGGKNGPRFVPGKILMSTSGVSTFIPGQVVYSSDRGSVFVPGNVVDTSSGPFFVPGRVIELPNGSIKFVPGEIIETDSGPRYVTEHETDLDLLDETEDQKEIVVQGFAITPEELRLITAYPFAALHYPSKDGDGPIINSRMLRQMAAAGVAVNKLTNANVPNTSKGDNSTGNIANHLNDVKVVAPKNIDESILGADVFRMTEPPPKPVTTKKTNNKEKTESTSSTKNENQDKTNKTSSSVQEEKIQPVGNTASNKTDGDHVGSNFGNQSNEIPAKETGKMAAKEPTAHSPDAGSETICDSAKTQTPPVVAAPKTDQPLVMKTSENQQSPNDTSLITTADGGMSNGLGQQEQQMTNGVQNDQSDDSHRQQQSGLNDASQSGVDHSSTNSQTLTNNDMSTSINVPKPPGTNSENKNGTDAANSNRNQVGASGIEQPVDTSQWNSQSSPSTVSSDSGTDGAANVGLLSSKDKVNGGKQDIVTTGAASKSGSLNGVEKSIPKNDGNDSLNGVEKSIPKNNGDDSNRANALTTGADGTDLSKSSNTVGNGIDSSKMNHSGVEDLSKLNSSKQTHSDGKDQLKPTSSDEKDLSKLTGTDSSKLTSDGRDQLKSNNSNGKDLSKLAKTDATDPPKMDDSSNGSLDGNGPNGSIGDGSNDQQGRDLDIDRKRDENSLERQVRDIFERIKRDLDSVENDTFIRQTLTDAESLALAMGRPDLADKVRQLLDILKNTERDPEVVDLIRQILRMRKEKQSKSDNGESSLNLPGERSLESAKNESSPSSLVNEIISPKDSLAPSSGQSTNMNPVEPSRQQKTSSIDNQQESNKSSDNSSKVKNSQTNHKKKDSDSTKDNRTAVKEATSAGCSTNGSELNASSSLSTATANTDGQGQTTSSIFKSEQANEQNATTTSTVEGSQMSTVPPGSSARRTKTQRTGNTNNSTADSSENKQPALSSDPASEEKSPLARPTELKGLQNATDSLSGSSDSTKKSSPLSGGRSPIDEAKMIDKWQYYNSPISPSDSHKTILERSNSKDSNNNTNANNNDQDKSHQTIQEENNPKDTIKEETAPPVRMRKSSRTNPRRVTSRSSSRLFADMDLSEETGDDQETPPTTVNTNGLSGPGDIIPAVITSAKDISREVIDTLRYSRDEAKKEYYTQKILEAVGLVSPSGPRSPSNESEEGSRGSGNNTNGQPWPSSGNHSRSRKGSTVASACIILKDFLQTIVPQEAAHNVLIGDIDYMVIDDEGVRYFESAMGFASRRNSRFDIRQASVRSRSGSHDHLADDGAATTTSGPWPWADVGPRARRASIDEFRKRLQEHDASISNRVRSPSRERSNRPPPHGRHSVAAFPLSRTSSGQIQSSVHSERNSRRGSLAEDRSIAAAIANSIALGRKRKVGSVEPLVNRRKLSSRPSFDAM